MVEHRIFFKQRGIANSNQGEDPVDFTIGRRVALDCGSIIAGGGSFKGSWHWGSDLRTIRLLMRRRDARTSGVWQGVDRWDVW